METDVPPFFSVFGVKLQLKTTGFPLIAARFPLPACGKPVAGSHQLVAGRFLLYLVLTPEPVLARLLEPS
jgi:hypothetical protein